MLFVPTVSLTVSREDEGTNDYGDPVTSTGVVLTDVPAHIYERTTTLAEPSSGRLATEKGLKAIIGEEYDIRRGDIIEDSRGRTYTVNNVKFFYNPFDTEHMEIELNKIT